MLGLAGLAFLLQYGVGGGMMVRLLLDATTDFVQIARDKLNGMQEGGGELPFAVAFVLIRMGVVSTGPAPSTH